jgi:hypothetical protein
MTKCAKLISTILLLALAGSGSAAHAQSGSASVVPGRYQAIPLAQPGRSTDVLIVDTVTGDVWKWFETAAAHGAVGSGIRYEGAAVPGAKPGEIVARWGFGQPVIQPPPNKRQ